MERSTLKAKRVEEGFEKEKPEKKVKQEEA
jgi:hypothetical protein